MTWAKSLGFLNVFQSHVPGPPSSPGGRWEQEQVGEEGQWSELRGRVSDLWIPEAAAPGEEMAAGRPRKSGMCTTVSRPSPRQTLLIN